MMYQRFSQRETHDKAEDRLQTQKKKLKTEHNLGKTLFDQNKYEDAVKHLNNGLQAVSGTFIEQSPEALSSKHWLGRALFELKRYTAARDILEQGRKLREGLLGRLHDDTLSTAYWLARTLYKLEDFSRAEKVFRKTLNGHERNLGNKNSITIWTKFWLARTLHKQNKNMDAVDLFEQTKEGFNHVAGNKEHINTFLTMHWLGVTYYELKKYADAENLFRQAVQGRVKLLGPKHTKTLSSENWLFRSKLSICQQSAEAHYHKSQYAAAEKRFQQTLSDRERVLSLEDPETLNSKHWLAMSIYSQKRYIDAEKIFQETLSRRERVLGLEHRDTLESRRWLAMSIYFQKRYKAAEKLFQQTLSSNEKVLGPDHDDTLDRKRWLAMSILFQARYKEAAKLLQQTLSSSEKVLGPGHPTVSHNKYWLARTLYMEGNFSEAKVLLPQAIQDFEDRGCDAIPSKILLQQILDAQENYKKPETLSQQAEIGHRTIFDDIKNLGTISTKLWPISTFKQLGKQIYANDGTGIVNNVRKKVCFSSAPSMDVKYINLFFNEKPVKIGLKLEVYDYCQTSTTPIRARLDTGSALNVISPHLAEILRYPPSTYSGANLQAINDVISPTSQVRISFRLAKPDKLFKETFVIVNGTPYDLILGEDFINKYNVLRMSHDFLPIALAPMSEDEKKKMKAEQAALEQKRKMEEEEERNARRKKRDALRRQSEIQNHNAPSTNS